MDVLCINFINTNWYNTHRDNREPFEDKSWLQSFQEKWGLQTETPPRDKDTENLKKLREVLEKAMDIIMVGDELSQEQLNDINGYLSLSVVSKSIEFKNKQYVAGFKPIKRDWNWVMSEVAASFAELISSQDIKRIKRCENPECRWVFYDESKNRTRRWCDNTCASLIKVRKFREKINK